MKGVADEPYQEPSSEIEIKSIKEFQKNPLE